MPSTRITQAIIIRAYGNTSPLKATAVWVRTVSGAVTGAWIAIALAPTAAETSKNIDDADDLSSTILEINWKIRYENFTNENCTIIVCQTQTNYVSPIFRQMNFSGPFYFDAKLVKLSACLIISTRLNICKKNTQLNVSATSSFKVDGYVKWNCIQWKTENEYPTQI